MALLVQTVVGGQPPDDALPHRTAQGRLAFALPPLAFSGLLILHNLGPSRGQVVVLQVPVQVLVAGPWCRPLLQAQRLYLKDIRLRSFRCRSFRYSLWACNKGLLQGPATRTCTEGHAPEVLQAQVLQVQPLDLASLAIQLGTDDCAPIGHGVTIFHQRTVRAATGCSQLQAQAVTW